MPTSPRDGTSAGKRIPLVWRLVISALLLVHLLAVFIPPFTFATASGAGTSSPFAMPIMQTLRPYIDFAYLDHGYFFFAPNPGPSHLLRARLEYSDGRPPQELTFPDRNKQWPRLLYHRHFMLAEQLHSEFVPSQPPPGLIDPMDKAGWQRAHGLYELRRKSFENHLRIAYGADKVTLTRVEHSLIMPGEYVARRPALDGADTFRDLSEELPDVTSALSRGDE